MGLKVEMAKLYKVVFKRTWWEILCLKQTSVQGFASTRFIMFEGPTKAISELKKGDRFENGRVVKKVVDTGKIIEKFDVY